MTESLTAAFSQLKFLLVLINRLWRNNVIPSAWTHFQIIPIPKKDSKLRPIALSSCIRKLVESMLNARLRHWSEQKGIIPHNCYGFRNKRSAIDCVTSLVSDIYQAFIDKQHLNALFIDIHSAFPSVSLPILRQTLQNLNIPPHFSTFILKLMSPQTFTFTHANYPSITRINYLGLPQGSSLSPILFNLYILTVLNIRSPATILSFADDLVIYHAHSQVATTTLHVTNTLSVLQNKLDQLLLSLSIPKCVSVLFSLRAYNLADACIFLKGEQIPNCSFFKYLGINLDSRLTWNIHISFLRTKCSQAMYILQALSSTEWGGDPIILSMLYKAIIRSKMEYGAFLFGSAAPSRLKKLDVLQNQALRYILGAIKTTPIVAMEAEAKIPPLQLRRIYLTQKYCTRLASWTNRKLILSFSNISRNWRFIPSKKPLLSRIIKKYSKLLHSLPSIDGYPYQYLTYFEIFHRWPLEILTRKHKVAIPLQFAELIETQFRDYRIIYTDGSKMTSGCGAAFYDSFSGVVRNFQICPGSSSYDCEVAAIFMALNFVSQSNPSSSPHNQILIASDSLSALHAIIESPYSHNISPTIINTRFLLQHLLHSKNISTSFMWIPSHKGIEGNERVDSAAKAACSSQSAAKYSFISANFLLGIAREENEEKWQRHYLENISLSSQYFHLENSIPTHPWYILSNYVNRKFTVSICRLRFNHNRLPYNLAKFLPNISPDCPFHPQDKIAADLNHILFQCPHLTTQQKTLHSSLINSNIQRPFAALNCLHITNLSVFPALYSFINSLSPTLTI